MRKFFLLMCVFWLAACDSDDSKQEIEPLALADTKIVHDKQIPDFRLTEVAQGIFVHQGVHVEIDHADHADIPNIGFIVGDQCVAVIDTGGSIVIGNKLRSAVKSKTELPICYVINTHVHFDHVLGNAAFTQDQPQFIGHINLQEAILQNKEFFLDNFPNDLGANPTEDMIIGPDVLVEDFLEIDLGNRKLLLTANPKSHTSTDLTIHDIKTNTLWLADLLFMERIPSLDGSLLGWFSLMEQLHGQQYAQVIPGHGPASAAWPAAMEPQQQYFQVLIDETRKAIADGIFLGDAITIVAESERPNWLFFDNLNKRAVSRAYRELEWE